jgi:hypothetical protein
MNKETAPMADPAAFAKLVPGFDFLQGLVKGAGSALPAMNQWIAPTLDADEIDKRIRDLRTVQFWLEQNAKMIGATVQALEVQRMTLATLKTMNLPLDAVRDALKARPADPAPAPAPAPRKARAVKAPAEAAPPAIDPMKWWAALTQQFGELAAQAVKDLPSTPPAPAPSTAPRTAPRPAPATQARPRRRKAA